MKASIGDYIGYRLGNVESAYRLAYKKLTHKSAPKHSINGSKILTCEEANSAISDKINNNEPLMVARFGSVELQFLNKYLCKCLGIIDDYPLSNRHTICNNAGFFPNNSSEMDKFAQLMLKSSSALDIIALWNDTHENHIVRKYAQGAKGTLLEYIRPCFYNNTWTRALAGKKVCVVHPFCNTIISQYERRELIYPKGELPEFDLRVVKAVQTIAGTNDNRFSTWFDALDYMKEQISSEDFDVAILGCGAYGFPLAAYVKSIGKKAVHLGGTTQLMFGIRGSRWKDDSEIGKKLYNDYWVYPSDEDTPKNFKQVENGCYWK